MWLEIKTDLMWWWVVVDVEGENRNKLGACQLIWLVVWNNVILFFMIMDVDNISD